MASTGVVMHASWPRNCGTCLESDRTTQYDKDPKMAKCFDKELRLELRLELSVHVARVVTQPVEIAPQPV